MDQQFHPFPRFPAEVQLMVWRLSMHPRVVSVNIVHSNRRPRANQSKVSWRVSRAPAQLAATLDSRNVALSLYQKLYFACPVPVRGDKGPAPVAMVYFHPELDVLSQDFEVIVVSYEGPDRIRRPGLKARLTAGPAPNTRWRGDFDDLYQLSRPLPKDFFDPFHNLAHIHVNMHLLMSSPRNPAVADLQTPFTFLQNLLAQGRAPDALQSITIRITIDMSKPPILARTHNLPPIVYRIVRTPSMPVASGSVIYLTQILAQNAQAVGHGLLYSLPCLRDVLQADGAVLTKPCGDAFSALRVIDVDSFASHFDDAGRPYPGKCREWMWWNMVVDGCYTWPADVVSWLAGLIAVPSIAKDWFDYREMQSPWGICGVNYGMGSAKVLLKPMEKVKWNWP
jgi:hypothetical protein